MVHIGPGGISPRSISILMYIIGGVWAIVTVADAFTTWVETPSGVNEVWLIIIGFLFAGRQAASRQEQENQDEDNSRGVDSPVEIPPIETTGGGSDGSAD